VKETDDPEASDALIVTGNTNGGDGAYTYTSDHATDIGLKLDTAPESLISILVTSVAR